MIITELGLYKCRDESRAEIEHISKCGQYAFGFAYGYGVHFVWRVEFGDIFNPFHYSSQSHYDIMGRWEIKEPEKEDCHMVGSVLVYPDGKPEEKICEQSFSQITGALSPTCDLNHKWFDESEKWERPWNVCDRCGGRIVEKKGAE